MENGNVPTNAAELTLAKHRTLNPSSASHVIFELELWGKDHILITNYFETI